LHFKTINAAVRGASPTETIGFTWVLDYDGDKPKGNQFHCICRAVETDDNSDLYNSFKPIIESMQNAFNVLLNENPVDTLVKTTVDGLNIERDLRLQWQIWDDARRAAAAPGGAVYNEMFPLPSGGKSLRKRTKRTRKTRRTKKSKKTRKHKRR
jgi:hypothetical protein